MADETVPSVEQHTTEAADLSAVAPEASESVAQDSNPLNPPFTEVQEARDVVSNVKDLSEASEDATWNVDFKPYADSPDKSLVEESDSSEEVVGYAPVSIENYQEEEGTPSTSQEDVPQEPKEEVNGIEAAEDGSETAMTTVVGASRDPQIRDGEEEVGPGDTEDQLRVFEAEGGPSQIGEGIESDKALIDGGGSDIESVPGGGIDTVGEGGAQSGDQEPLEEVESEPQARGPIVELGKLYTFGTFEVKILQALRGPWFVAKLGEQVVFAKPNQNALAWKVIEGMEHRVLPKVLYAGPEGMLVKPPPSFSTEQTTQDSIFNPSFEEYRGDLPKTLNVVKALAQAVTYLHHKNYAVLAIEPWTVFEGPLGTSLLVPPKIAVVGSPHPASSEDFPKVVGGSEGVAELARLLGRLYLGIDLDDGYIDPTVESYLRVAGLPQLLHRLRQTGQKGPKPSEVGKLLGTFKDPIVPKYQVAAATTVGVNPTRYVNEDAFGLNYQDSGGSVGSLPIIRACVSDGMGGMSKGEVASAAAVRVFMGTAMPADLKAAKDLKTVASLQSEWTKQLGVLANQEVLQALAGANGGCTLTGVVVIGNQVSLVHVGDSRLYLLSSQGINQLSVDHSLAVINKQVYGESHVPDPSEVSTLVRSLGERYPRGDKLVDTFEPTLKQEVLELQVGDTLLLLSDGVWGSLDDSALQTALPKDLDLQQALDGLIARALEVGSDDNATAVAVRRIA